MSVCYIERLRPAGFVEPDRTTAEYRDKMVNWITDSRRGLDYLETRNDIDAKKMLTVVRVLARVWDLFLLQLTDGTRLVLLRLRESENPTLSGLRKPT